MVINFFLLIAVLASVTVSGTSNVSSSNKIKNVEQRQYLQKLLTGERLGLPGFNESSASVLETVVHRTTHLLQLAAMATGYSAASVESQNSPMLAARDEPKKKTEEPRVTDQHASRVVQPAAFSKGGRKYLSVGWEACSNGLALFELTTESRADSAAFRCFQNRTPTTYEAYANLASSSRLSCSVATDRLTCECNEGRDLVSEGKKTTISCVPERFSCEMQVKNPCDEGPAPPRDMYAWVLSTMECQSATRDEDVELNLQFKCASPTTTSTSSSSSSSSATSTAEAQYALLADAGQLQSTIVTGTRSELKNRNVVTQDLTVTLSDQSTVVVPGSVVKSMLASNVRLTVTSLLWPSKSFEQTTMLVENTNDIATILRSGVRASLKMSLFDDDFFAGGRLFTQICWFGSCKSTILGVKGAPIRGPLEELPLTVMTILGITFALVVIVVGVIVLVAGSVKKRRIEKDYREARAEEDRVMRQRRAIARESLIFKVAAHTDKVNDHEERVAEMEALGAVQAEANTSDAEPEENKTKARTTVKRSESSDEDTDDSPDSFAETVANVRSSNGGAKSLSRHPDARFSSFSAQESSLVKNLSTDRFTESSSIHSAQRHRSSRKRNHRPVSSDEN